MALEAQSASLASENSTRASRAAIKSALDRMTVAVDKFAHRDSSNEYNEADIDFHGALALAIGNQMLALLLTGLGDSLRASFKESFEGRVARGHSLEETLQRHVVVYERVVHRDRRGAAAAMRATLRESKRDLLANLSHSYAANPRISNSAGVTMSWHRCFVSTPKELCHFAR
jgi:DNA-binding FadR family transcriptional regulator